MLMLRKQGVFIEFGNRGVSNDFLVLNSDHFEVLVRSSVESLDSLYD